MRFFSKRQRYPWLTGGAVLCTSFVALAAVMDTFGPPPAGDPSAFTGPAIGTAAAIDALAGLAPANEGAFEGGVTGTKEDAHDNVVTRLPGTGVDIPTGARPSPLFGALPFTQKLLLFEEFGRDVLPGAPAAPNPFPQPATGPAPENDPGDPAATGPLGTALEAFLGQAGISPFPTEFANTTDANPWKTAIEAFLGRTLVTPPAEGRPPGKGWAHQRWNEFNPRVFFKTAQAGARVNHGFRDAKQRHGYALGEFAPGGLYHQTFTSTVPGTTVTGTTNGIGPRIHPLMPAQNHKAVWTFDGTFPPKLAVARYGEPILMRHYNALPIDPAANRGFGIHTLSTHEHNGHNPAESDGYTNAFFFPGQFYDYRWPMQLAGHDTVNTTGADPRAAAPCAPGETILVNDTTTAATARPCDANGRVQIRGDWRETMSTHWFHDHMLDFTAQNVYKGNAAMFNYYSAIDRGNEAHNDGVNLRLPSGSALPWGNRDYDVNLVIADKAWDDDGQLWFNIFNKDGFLGDQVLVNWQYKPYMEVRARRYRFRILNGSVSRYFSFALVKQVNGTGGELGGPMGSSISYNRVPFYLVANDGNLMEHAIPFDGTMDLDGDGNAAEHKGQLPTQGIAERFDIVVDFAQAGIAPGDKLYLVNTTKHRDGQQPDGKVPLVQILNKTHNPVATATGWSADPGAGMVMEFRVVAYSGTDLSMNPANFRPGQQKMIPLPIQRNDPRLQNARHRVFDFDRSAGTDESPWTIKTDEEEALVMDPRRISAAPRLATGPTQPGFVGTNAAGNDTFGTFEIWTIDGNGGWSHPVHIHFEEAIILSRDSGPLAEWEKWARKDVFRIGPEDDASNDLTIAIRFREFAGTYMEHCHNTQHEDHAMLLRWDLEHPGQTKLMPAPIPGWDGVEYVDSAALPTFRSGYGFGLDP
ncbi:MAG TPA: multicopper oxidase domain-containing protein [Polyangiaceae bacterium]|nr:multicopper oxidase domain-containing protein [Polyangiaceae bacterium]